MASLTDILFGTDSEANVTTESNISPEQRAILDQLLAALSPEATAPATGELSTTQTGAQSEIDKIISSGALSGSVDTLKGITEQSPQDIDNLFTNTVANPLTREFNEKILPNISRRFGGEFFGSDRREADARATEDLIQSLTGSRSQFAFDAEEAQRNRSLQSAGMIPGAATGVAGFGAGADLSELQRRQNEEERLRILQLLFGGATSPTQENIATVTPGSTGAVTSFLSGVGKGAGSTLAGG